MMNVYSFNDSEVLMWANSGQEASQTYLELFDGVINDMQMIDNDELIYLVYENDETGEYEWTLEPQDRKVLRTTTVGELAKEIEK